MIKKVKNNVKKTFDVFRLRTSFVFFLACFVCSLQAQVFEMNNMPPPEIQFAYSSGELSDESALKARITIAPSWHVNANVFVDEFLKPSEIKATAQGMEFGEPVWPKPKKDYNEILAFENQIFEGTFEVLLPVKKLENHYDSLTTEITFSYQACSNSICLAPASVTVNASFLTEPFHYKKAKKVSESVSAEKQKSLPEKSENKMEKTEIPPEKILKTATKNTEDKFLLVEEQVPEKSTSSLLLFLFFAFAGGFILNFMPCVLPVLSLKLFSLVKEANNSREHVFKLSFATVSGILISFLVLACIVVFMRLFGGTPGFGMQFQSIYFIASMVAVLTLFAMSFFNVFEIFLPGTTVTKLDKATKKEGVLGAFFTGALLVLLSTPCSAPLLGSAMGFAFNESAPILFLFFFIAGIGLSLPYILIAIAPSLLKILPKPGRWMLLLQRVMGFLLLVSVFWLCSLGYESFSFSGLVFLVAILVLNVFCAFFIGKFAPPYKPFSREILAFLIVIVLNIFVQTLGSSGISIRTEKQVDGYVNYSEEKLEALQNAGKTVFLDITADWCLTCKANEMAVLSDEALNTFLEKENVIKMRADWTHGDKEITALLKSLGKSGVPAYAIYPANKNEKPIVLLEILTVDLIREKILNLK